MKFKIFVETQENEVYKIRMRRSKQPTKIQKEIVSKISSYKTDKKFNSVEIQLELHEKLLDIYLMHSDRQTKTLLDFKSIAK